MEPTNKQDTSLPELLCYRYPHLRLRLFLAQSGIVYVMDYLCEPSVRLCSLHAVSSPVTCSDVCRSTTDSAKDGSWPPSAGKRLRRVRCAEGCCDGDDVLQMTEVKRLLQAADWTLAKEPAGPLMQVRDVDAKELTDDECCWSRHDKRM